ncbi:MAG: hypothetical protein JWP32_1066, partial [Schumannella sp.]|nr:hypothetical protein [Schumannella sp.]
MRSPQAGRVTLDQTIAGYRVLRLLANGTRSRVSLAPGDRVLKVLAGSEVAGEALALHRARGDHVVALLDAAVDDDGAVLVFPRLPRGSLADVLAGRPGLDAGEAVTVLAPITAALARMHAAGVAHGAVSASHVLFRADGAPMLIGFGSARVHQPGLPEVALERIDGVIADRAALAALAVAVLSRVTGPRAAAAGALVTRMGLETTGLETTAQQGEHGDLETRLCRELFELAGARPVTLEPEPAAETGLRRAVDVADVHEPPAADPAEGRRRLGAVLGLLLESGPGSMLRTIVRERWKGWSPRQRTMAIAVAAGAADLVVAVVALPGAPSASDPPGVGAVESPAPVETPDHYPPSAVTQDDPLAALGELLTRRTEC